MGSEILQFKKPQVDTIAAGLRTTLCMKALELVYNPGYVLESPGGALKIKLMQTFTQKLNQKALEVNLMGSQAENLSKMGFFLTIMI